MVASTAQQRGSSSAVMSAQRTVAQKAVTSAARSDQPMADCLVSWRVGRWEVHSAEPMAALLVAVKEDQWAVVSAAWTAVTTAVKLDGSSELRWAVQKAVTRVASTAGTWVVQTGTRTVAKMAR